MHGVGVYDESAGELVGTDVVNRERAADDVRGVLCVKALVKQLQNHGCNEAFSADLAAAESSAFHRRLEPDEPNFLFSA